MTRCARLTARPTSQDSVPTRNYDELANPTTNTSRHRRLRRKTLGQAFGNARSSSANASAIPRHGMMRPSQPARAGRSANAEDHCPQYPIPAGQAGADVARVRARRKFAIGSLTGWPRALRCGRPKYECAGQTVCGG